MARSLKDIRRKELLVLLALAALGTAATPGELQRLLRLVFRPDAALARLELHGLVTKNEHPHYVGYQLWQATARGNDLIHAELAP